MAPAETGARLLGAEPPKRRGDQSPKGNDLERQAGEDDRRPLLLGQPVEASASVFDGQTEQGGRCREFVARLFGSAYNPDFANDAELAVRAAFFVVVVGLPFLIPRNELPTLDYYMKAGVYTNSVVIFFIYNLYKTTGETILNVVCGFRGTLLAVVNTWAMYFLFPEGVTETSPDFVLWVGVANGIAFISIMLLLNWQMSTTIFAVSNFVFYWMSFLQPGDDSFQCPFTNDFRFLGNTGINSLITVSIGGFLCIMVTFLPYPRWAHFEARRTGQELVHMLPLLWQTLAEFFCEEKLNVYRADQILRRLDRLSKMTSTMKGHIGSSWYECFGRKEWHHVRRILTAMEKMISECYDRIHSTYNITASEEWTALHAELMVRVQGSMMATITEVEVLLHVCFQSAFDGQFSEIEEIAMQKVCNSVREREAEFLKSFAAARVEVLQMQGHADDSQRIQQCMDDLLPEHIFMMNFSSFVRSVLGFAEDLIKQRQDPTHLPKVTEIPAISSLWDPSVLRDPSHLNWSLRAGAAILSGFFFGFHGYADIFSPYNAGIACTASVLLSKFPGSAVVKNLGRIQGVVLGSIVGQIVHGVFESCEAWSVSVLALCLFFYAVVTLFTYYHSTDFSYIGCLLAGFGCGQMLMGGCGVHNLNKATGYDQISGTVCATALIVFFDAIFPPGRASDMAHTALVDAVGSLDQALVRHFDKNVDHVRFHRGDVHDAISKAESMCKEANHEPRFWRTAWKNDTFVAVVHTAYKIRYSLAAMEYSMSEGFKDGGVKNHILRSIEDTPECIRLVAVVRNKLESVRGLLDIFVHETATRFPGLDDPRALQVYRFELKDAQRAFSAEFAKHPSMMSLLDAKPTSLEEDPVCQACAVLGSMTMILSGLRKLQHAVLRGC